LWGNCLWGNCVHAPDGYPVLACPVKITEQNVGWRDSNAAPSVNKTKIEGRFSMKTISKGFAALVLTILGAPMADAASLTYTFTGVVTNAQGSFATYNGQSVIGDTVTGTYVFNYDAAIPLQSSGTPGSNAWNSHSDFLGTFPPGGSLGDLLVFISTAQVVGTNISYATTPPSGTGFNIGSYATGNGGTGFQASEQANQANAGDTQSTFGLGSIPPVYDSSGGPVYQPSSQPGSGSGNFGVAAGGDTGVINYNITSISPVPLPAAGWLTMTMLGAVGVMARKRRI
jgi:hypothetical protein